MRVLRFDVSSRQSSLYIVASDMLLRAIECFIHIRRGLYGFPRSRSIELAMCIRFRLLLANFAVGCAYAMVKWVAQEVEGSQDATRWGPARQALFIVERLDQKDFWQVQDMRLQ